jgi:hypothetical protein
MSGPISAKTTSPVRRSTPGMVNSNPTSEENGTRTRATSTPVPLDRLVQLVDAGQHLPDQQRAMGPKAAFQRLA